MRRIGRFLALPGPEQRLFVKAWAWVSVLAVALRAGGLRRAQALAGARARISSGREVPPARIARLVALAASCSPFPATCLPTALALQRLLMECGVAAELRVGVRKVGDQLEAHSWVEIDGVPVSSDGVEAPFAAFDQPLTRPKRAST